MIGLNDVDRNDRHGDFLAPQFPSSTLSFDHIRALKLAFRHLYYILNMHMYVCNV